MHLFWENTKSENVTFNRILLTHKDLNLLNYNPTQIFPWEVPRVPMVLLITLPSTHSLRHKEMIWFSFSYFTTRAHWHKMSPRGVCSLEDSAVHVSLVFAGFWTRTGFKTVCDVTNRARRPRLLKSDLNSAADVRPHGEASACSQTSAVCAPSLVSCRLNGDRSHINIPACCLEINIISMTRAVGRTGGFSSAVVGVHCNNAAVWMIIYCMLLSCCSGLRSDLYGFWFNLKESVSFIVVNNLFMFIMSSIRSCDTSSFLKW